MGCCGGGNNNMHNRSEKMDHENAGGCGSGKMMPIMGIVLLIALAVYFIK